MSAKSGIQKLADRLCFGKQKPTHLLRRWSALLIPALRPRFGNEGFDQAIEALEKVAGVKHDVVLLSDRVDVGLAADFFTNRLWQRLCLRAQVGVHGSRKRVHALLNGGIARVLFNKRLDLIQSSLI